MQAPEGIDIIIPTFNESTCIGQLFQFLKMQGLVPLHLIISDGQSTDDTCEIAAKEGAFVVKCPLQGRAVQMNYGASFAHRSVL
jgi:glycosyltransferase involved in cell wall biosynthesis